MAKVTYPGTALRLGAETRIVPPLALGQVKAFRPLLIKIEAFAKAAADSAKAGGAPLDQNASADVMFECYVPIIKAALERNYPEITIEAVESMLDMGNYNDALKAAMGRSDGEVVDEVGETPAVAGPTLSIGASSTAA